VDNVEPGAPAGGDILEEVRREVARIRAGGTAGRGTESLLHALDEMPGQETEDLERTLRLAVFGSSDPELVRRIVAYTVPFVHDIGWTTPPLGLILRDGDPLAGPFPDNPWGIPSTATLEEAITCLWGWAERHVDGFVAELRRRLLGLAVWDRGDDTMVLKYLIYRELDRDDVAAELRDAPRPPFDRRNALDWEPFGDFEAFFGDSPVADPVAVCGLPLPAGLCALYGVHGLMGDGMWDLWHPNKLVTWDVEAKESEPSRMWTFGDEVRMTNDVVEFLSSGGSPGYVLDLAGGHPEPLVRWCDGPLHEPKDFWTWFAGWVSSVLGMGRL
jgi:hypothetical protein